MYSIDSRLSEPFPPVRQKNTCYFLRIIRILQKSNSHHWLLYVLIDNNKMIYLQLSLCLCNWCFPVMMYNFIRKPSTGNFRTSNPWVQIIWNSDYLNSKLSELTSTVSLHLDNLYMLYQRNCLYVMIACIDPSLIFFCIPVLVSILHVPLIGLCHTCK